MIKSIVRGPQWASCLSALAVGMVVLTSACSPPNKETGSPASGPTSEWKEGYGGDSVAIEVVREIENICFRTRTMRKGILSSSLETDKDVASEVCGLLEPNALRVEPIEQPMVNGVAKDAANFPSARPRRLEVKREYWKSADPDKRLALLLHEILPLVGLEDADYVRSTRVLLALEAKVNRVTIVSCDEKRIEAMYAGGEAEFLRFYTRDFGANRCKEVIAVLKRHVAAGNFEEELRKDIQHYYVWGVFTELVRAKNRPDMDKAMGLLQESLYVLPDAFAPWSPETCVGVAQAQEHQPMNCGGFLNVVAGASAKLKFMTAGLNSKFYSDDFERAVLHLMGLIQMDSRWDFSTNPILRNEQVSSSLVQSAIEGQNWITLYFLGRMQRKINSESRPSDVLLKDINFQMVRQKAPHVDLGDGTTAYGHVPFGTCLPEEIRVHAATILNGTNVFNLVCGSAGSI